MLGYCATHCLASPIGIKRAMNMHAAMTGIFRMNTRYADGCERYSRIRAHKRKHSGNGPCRELRKTYPEFQIICSVGRTCLRMMRYGRGFLGSADCAVLSDFGMASLRWERS